jgi:site-specific recombinase XerD
VERRRHHMDESVLQRAVKETASKVGLEKSASGHTLWHSCAPHLVEGSYDMRAFQELLGHRDVRVIMIDTHIPTC